MQNIRSNEADPHTHTFDHLKIFLANTPQDGVQPKKIAQGMFKIGRALNISPATISESKLLLQYQVFRKEESGLKIELISKPNSLDVESLKNNVLEYMTKPMTKPITTV